MESAGVVDLDTGVVYAWPNGPIAAATPPPPNPPQCIGVVPLPGVPAWKCAL
jgi:hypothetical protein